MLLLCSICGKSNRHVEHMLAGRKGNICSECVDLCTRVLAEIRHPTEQPAPAEART